MKRSIGVAALLVALGLTLGAGGCATGMQNAPASSGAPGAAGAAGAPSGPAGGGSY